MKNLFICFLLSISIHSFIFISFNLIPLKSNFPLGKTVIGKLRISTLKTQNVSPAKNDKTSYKKQKDIKHNQANVKEQIATQNPGKNNLEYINYIRKIVEQNKVYPFVARKMKIQGMNEVKVSIAYDGTYQYTLAVLAKNSVLNDATKIIFDKIKKFKPLPKGQTKLELSIPIQYQLNEL